MSRLAIVALAGLCAAVPGGIAACAPGGACALTLLLPEDAKRVK
jgi:hypothetical protein